jgi:hypothetical protein
VRRTHSKLKISAAEWQLEFCKKYTASGNFWWGEDIFVEPLTTATYLPCSIWITILENPAIKPKVEYQVRKWTNNKGFVDLLIADKKNQFLRLVHSPRSRDSDWLAEHMAG